MKAVRSAYVLLCISILVVFINSLVLNRLISKTLDEVKMLPESLSAESHQEYERLYKDFKKKEQYISLTVNHEDLTEVESSFSEIVGAAKANDEEAFLTIKSRLIDALDHLRRLSGINIDSIL